VVKYLSPTSKEQKREKREKKGQLEVGRKGWKGMMRTQVQPAKVQEAVIVTPQSYYLRLNPLSEEGHLHKGIQRRFSICLRYRKHFSLAVTYQKPRRSR